MVSLCGKCYCEKDKGLSFGFGMMEKMNQLNYSESSHSMSDKTFENVVVVFGTKYT